jgi:preprotein translocase subunit SecE
MTFWENVFIFIVVVIWIGAMLWGIDQLYDD